MAQPLVMVACGLRGGRLLRWGTYNAGLPLIADVLLDGCARIAHSMAGMAWRPAGMASCSPFLFVSLVQQALGVCAWAPLIVLSLLTGWSNM